ncbi:MAG: hypothetical protein E6I62_05925 [Chloroflexi bacterium]|nr:MAG: hypothetical protein E6I62_05925 [Chloroflexota bacterium]
MILAPVAPLAATAVRADSSCQLNSANGEVKHVIYIQFDNTHFRRDNPNVPSDLEQMPNLLNFIKSNGTLVANDHTVLISHTATGILSSLTGNYPDRFGQPVSNSFRYFKTDGTTRTGVSFAYWTAPLFDPAGSTTDTTPEMINENGKISPAPWVPYTRAGCDVGAVATANTVLENTAIDIPTVFGAGSDEAQEVIDNPGQAFADFVGIGVHCAQGSSVCGASTHARPDTLPDEPLGYAGYSGLFGAKYVNPVIKPSGPMTDLSGNVIQDATGHIGFPGFDGMEATVSLSYVAQMQEAGVPITYAYISDAHDGHGTSGNIHFAYGPGEAGYVQQLHDYDTAFGQFFNRLAADGINKSNTLFVFTVDEGDHFAGADPTNPGCDGGNTPCTYPAVNGVGEINADLRRMIYTQFGDATLFSVHSDDAPTVYVNGTAAQPIRDQTDPIVRNLERETAQLHWLNPYTGSVENNIMVAQADHVGMKALHMVTADPFRTPTYTPFADPDWFFFATGGATPATCATPEACAFIPARTAQSFAWNHGDIQDEIASTWAGLVGPGVQNQGVNASVWTDHTDWRPTMLSLLGLKDDYVQDGRVVTEVLAASANPQSLRLHRGLFQQLASAYKQLNAPFGTFSMAVLKKSSEALASNAAGDADYTSIENQITSWTSDRDGLATTIKNTLADSEFNGVNLDVHNAQSLISQANALINEVVAAAS